MPAAHAVAPTFWILATAFRFSDAWHLSLHQERELTGDQFHDCPETGHEPYETTCCTVDKTCRTCTESCDTCCVPRYFGTGCEKNLLTRQEYTPEMCGLQLSVRSRNVDQGCDAGCTYYYPPSQPPTPPPPPPSPPSLPPPCLCPYAGTYALLCHGNCPVGSSCTCPSCEVCPAGEFRTGCEGYSPGYCVGCPSETYKEESEHNYWHTTCNDCEPCPIGSDETRAAKLGCTSKSSGYCVPITFTQPACTGLMPWYGSTLAPQPGTCTTWYEGEQVIVNLEISSSFNPDDVYGPHLERPYLGGLGVALERQDEIGAFRLLDAFCAWSASDLDGRTSFACRFEVPYMHLSNTAALPVFRVRANYTSSRSFESATATSDAFIIRSRAELYSRQYADAALLTDQVSMQAAMGVLCNETAVDNVSAIEIQRACQCADFSVNDRDCAGLDSDVLPALRKTSSDAMTVACDNLLANLGLRATARRHNEVLTSLNSIVQTISGAVQASQETIVADIKAKITTSMLESKLDQYRLASLSLSDLLVNQRSNLHESLQIHRDMISQFDQLNERARTSFEGLFAAGGLVANVNASRRLEIEIAREDYRQAMKSCEEARRRMAFLNAILGIIKGIAAVVLIAFNAFKGNLGGVIGGGKLLIDGVGHLGSAFDFELPGLNYVDNVLGKWPTVLASGNDRPVTTGACDTGFSLSCATASVNNLRNGFLNKVDINPSSLNMAKNVGNAVDKIGAVLNSLIGPSDELMAYCNEAGLIQAKIEQLRRELLLVSQFNLASFALAEASADMQRQGLHALHGRRLPLIHLSSVKQAHAMVGAGHFLEALFDGSQLTQARQIQFKEKLTDFRVSLEASSKLQADMFQNALNIRRQVNDYRSTQSEEERVESEKKKVEALLARVDQQSELPIQSAAEGFALVLATNAMYADNAPIEAEIALCQHAQLNSIRYQCPELDIPSPICTGDALSCRNRQIQAAYESCESDGASLMSSWKRFAVELDLSSDAARWDPATNTAYFCLDPPSANRAFYYEVRSRREWAVFMNTTFTKDGQPWTPNTNEEEVRVTLKRYGESVLINSTGGKKAWFVGGEPRMSETSYSIRSCDVQGDQAEFQSDRNRYHTFAPYYACWSAGAVLPTGVDIYPEYLRFEVLLSRKEHSIDGQQPDQMWNHTSSSSVLSGTNPYAGARGRGCSPWPGIECLHSSGTSGTFYCPVNKQCSSSCSGCGSHMQGVNSNEGNVCQEHPPSVITNASSLCTPSDQQCLILEKLSQLQNYALQQNMQLVQQGALLEQQKAQLSQLQNYALQQSMQLVQQSAQLEQMYADVNKTAVELAHVKAELKQLELPAVQWSCALGPDHSNCRCQYQFEANSNAPTDVIVTCAP